MEPSSVQSASVLPTGGSSAAPLGVPFPENTMNSSFVLIINLVSFLDPLSVDWFVSGGWAIDIHLNRVTRERCDLDISVPFSDRLKCIEFFLGEGWRIEGKLGGGFRTLHKVSDYYDDILYFWSFPEGVDFVSEYVDDDGNRRIAYNRDSQNELDYIEVFFNIIKDGHFIFREDPRVKRRKERAILERDSVRYLAPEVVLLFKSNRLSEKNKMITAQLSQIQHRNDALTRHIANLNRIRDEREQHIHNLETIVTRINNRLPVRIYRLLRKII